MPCSYRLPTPDSRLSILTMNNEPLTLDHPSKSLEEYINLGNSYTQKQEWEQAIDAYDRALKLNSELVEVYRNVVIACQKIDRKKLSAEYQYQLFKLESHSVSAEEYYSLGNELWFFARPGKAADCYRQAIALNSHFIEAYSQLGKLLTQVGQLDKALNAYQNGVKNNSYNFSLQFLLAETLSNQNNYPEAIQAYNRCLKINPKSSLVYFNLAEIYKHQKNWEEAITNYEKTLQLDLSNWQACFQLGNIWQQQQKYREAIQAYERAIQINSNAIEVYLNLGYLFSQQGNWEQALQNYLKTIQINSYGFSFEEKAIAGYREVVQLNPKSSAKHHYDLGKVLREKRNFSEAIKEYQQAIQSNPHLEVAYVALQYTSIDPRQLDELITFYHQLLQNRQDLPMAWGNLGDALTQQGKLEEAINCYQTSSYQTAIASHPELADLEWKPRKENPPDFLIIGAAKCGTSSLHKYLNYHPQILFPHKKELDFFWRHYDKGIDWYLAQFPSICDRPDFLTGEATPNYIRFPEVAQRIYQLHPNIKLILLLRNPIDRAVSWHYHKLNTGLNRDYENIEHAIATELQQIADFSEEKIINTGYYSPDNILSSLYIYKVREWMKYFSGEQLLVLKSEDFYENTEVVMKQVFNFLELPEHKLDKYIKVNAGSYQPIGKDLRKTLGNYFQPYNKQLEDFLGMKFNWQ
jgi:tetratricopeptide (TPR) repeat protein